MCLLSVRMIMINNKSNNGLTKEFARSVSMKKISSVSVLLRIYFNGKERLVAECNLMLIRHLQSLRNIVIGETFDIVL